MGQGGSWKQITVGRVMRLLFSSLSRDRQPWLREWGPWWVGNGCLQDSPFGEFSLGVSGSSETRLSGSIPWALKSSSCLPLFFCLPACLLASSGLLVTRLLLQVIGVSCPHSKDGCGDKALGIGGSLLLPGLPNLMGTPLPLLGLGLLGPPLYCTHWPQRLYHTEQAASLPEGTPPSLPHLHTSSDQLYNPPPPSPAEPGKSQQLP